MELLKKQTYNFTLEQSPEYQRILSEVMREVYTTFVNDRIADYERYYANQEETEDAYKDEEDPVMIEFFKNLKEEQKACRESRKKKVEEAKKLLPSDPEKAARLFMQLGSCHTLWALQKRILKEKYNITWYTPAELHPDIRYD